MFFTFASLVECSPPNNGVGENQLTLFSLRGRVGVPVHYSVPITHSLVKCEKSRPYPTLQSAIIAVILFLPTKEINCCYNQIKIQITMLVVFVQHKNRHKN